MRNIVLIGGGGHCKSVIDVIEQEGRFEIVGIVERPDFLETDVLGYQIIGNDSDLVDLAKKYKYALITVGQIKSPSLRIKLFDLATKAGFTLPNIISPNAYVSRHSSIGNGVVVMHNAIVNASASIGDNCIINSKALIEHDVVIKNHCHISTGSIVNGGALIKNRVFFGSNSTTREGVIIESDLVFGAGSLILK